MSLKFIKSAFVVANLFAISQAAPNYCPLCGQEPVLQSPPVPNEGAVSFDFGLCCPFADTRGDDCVVNPTGEAARTTGLETAILDGVNDFEEAHLTLSNFMFERSGRSSCCESCTCFGDPNCISFDGNRETWVVCDGRQVPRNTKKQARGFCPITQEQCAKEVDPYGQPCMWAPDKLGVNANNWDIRRLGSPCQPTNESIITMYIADSFEFRIGQGERGNIISSYLTLGQNEYSMSAESCVNNGRQNSWAGSPINDYFERIVVPNGPQGNSDIQWYIFDPATGISVTIRCSSHFYGVARVQARMDIESILEPDENYERTRNPVGGFCATNNLGNQYPSANSERIERYGFCYQNAPDPDVLIARTICQDPTLTLSSIGQCFSQFCNHYWKPYYNSFYECYSVISDRSNEDHWKTGFCKAFTSLPQDFMECMEIIDDYGWEYAVNAYYQKDRSVSGCVSDFSQLPDSLATCELGVELQYWNENSANWVTVKGIPQNMPPCSNTVFELDYEDYPELFMNRIRWIQKREFTDCLFDICSRQDGFFVDLRTRLVTASPSRSPTESPTPQPSRSPTVSPTPQPSRSPTISPTFKPSPEPTEEPTPGPTLQPSRSPTDSPTPEPATPILPNPPTASPTGSPFPFPSFCALEDIKLIDLFNSTLIYNNLGGLGPNFDENRNPLPSTVPVIWYHHAFIFQDQWVDVVIRNVTQYRPSNTNISARDGVSNNGKYFELGQINMKCAFSTVVEYVFVNAECAENQPDGFNPATNPICDQPIEDVEWTVYDLDHHFDGDNTESAVICKAFRPVPVFEQAVLINEASPNFCPGEPAYKLTAVTFGTDADNPHFQELQKLRLEQVRKIGRVLMVDNVSRFLTQYALTGPDPPNYRPRCGRRILFSGTICDQPLSENDRRLRSARKL